MANLLFKNLWLKDSPYEWTDIHQKCFELIKFALVSALVRGHPESGQAYCLYTDASDYAIAGALQQIQFMAIKDLRTRVHKWLHEAFKKGKKVPDLVTRLSKEFDDWCPMPEWSDDWEDTLIPVEWVVAYWSWVLASAETQYSATEWEALAAKESLICFQPFKEGERILLVTDHSALTWAKMYENANRRLAAWGLVFAAFPELAVIHRPGRMHSNVNPLSRFPRIPTFILPSRDDLPEPSLSTEYEDLQWAWLHFIREREHKLEVKTATVNATKECEYGLHVYLEDDIIKWFMKGYQEGENFKALVSCSQSEGFDKQKYCAYKMGTNGLLYFEDADLRIRLCILNSEWQEVLKEVHDKAHEGTHAGWERTLATLRDHFYWPRMRLDVIEYIQTCDPCQKIKHSRGAGIRFLQPLEIPATPFEDISHDLITGLPKSLDKDAILVVIDKLTKYTHFIAMATEVTALKVASLLFKRIAKHFGLPTHLIGDCDPRWTSTIWKVLAQMFGTQLALSTSKHPQMDGQTEVMNQHLKTMLWAYCYDPNIPHDRVGSEMPPMAPRAWSFSEAAAFPFSRYTADDSDIHIHVFRCFITPLISLNIVIATFPLITCS
jgi:hypothetical protein